MKMVIIPFIIIASLISFKLAYDKHNCQKQSSKELSNVSDNFAYRYNTCMYNVQCIDNAEQLAVKEDKEVRDKYKNCNILD